MIPRSSVGTDVDVCPFDNLYIFPTEIGPASKPMVISSHIFKLVVGVLVANVAWSTTIIAIHTHDQVLIGADSLEITLDSAGNEIGRQNVCKFVRKQSAVYTFSGYASFGTFNGCRIANRDGTGDVLSSVGRLAQSISQELSGALVSERPVGIEGFAKADHPILTLYVAGVTNEPTLYIVLFNLNRNWTVTPMLITKNEVSVIWSENTHAVEQAIPNNWSKGDLAALIHRLMRIGIENDKGRSGGPISIIRVSSSHTKWLNSGECGANYGSCGKGSKYKR